MRHTQALFTLVCATAATLVVGAQVPQTPRRVQQGEQTTVSAVMVDVVVRDRRGEPVRDLTPGDFEIYEDGVRQEVGSFTPVFKSEAGAPLSATGVAGAVPLAPAEPQMVALVFDRLTPDARALAYQAALNYIGAKPLAPTTMGVFGIDLSLIVYQPFTRNTALLRSAIGSVGGRSTSQFGTNREQLREAQDRQLRGGSAMSGVAAAGAGGPGAGEAAAGAATAAAEQQFATMQARMVEGFRTLERDQQGYTTSNALMAIVTAMRVVPGRKSVVFFSEGLSIPPNVQAQFLSVIDAANRANVSIYSMDAAGLRTESTLAETMEGQSSGRRSRLNQNPSAEVTGAPMMAELERNEDLLRADPHSGLGLLANETGGLLIARTNDLKRGFERIESDMRNYYMLTYVPANLRLDGKYRTIDVKVRRRDVNVHARKGYFAVGAPAGVPVLTYEAPALALLDRIPVPNAFPVRVATLAFPEAKRPPVMSVLVNFQASALTFQVDDAKQTFAADASVVVRFKEAGGEIVEKASQRYQFQGTVAQLEQAKRADVLFYREPALQPGTYTMETVVHDALSDKASVRLSTVQVPTVDPNVLRVSSLTLVRRSERVPENERQPDNPLYVGDQLLYPSMGEPLKKGADTHLGFYFVVYPKADAGDVTATVQLLRNAQVVAQAPLTLEAASQGRVAHVSRLPIETLEPSTYELRVVVRQGPAMVSRSTLFRIVS